MSTKSIIAAALAVGSASSALAAPTYIHAGRLIAVPGKPPRGPSTIVVDNGRIVSVSDGLARIEPGVPYIDLTGRTVLPGLIDSHVHLDSDRAGNEGLVASFTESPQLGAYETLWNARKTLTAGFTTVRNLGDSGSTLALRDAISRGWAVGPRIVDAGKSISTTSGHMDTRLGIIEDFHQALGEEQLC